MPIHRRSAMKVRDGRVLKKNNWRLDPADYPRSRRAPSGLTGAGRPKGRGI
jgi:nitrogen fixation protein